MHHSDVTARTLPAGTVLGRGAAWKGGPAVEFVPIYPDGTSYNELTADRDLSARAALRAEAFRTTDDYRLLFYVPGGGFQQFPPGAVKRISAGNALAWNVHYTPTGKPEVDRHRLGLWFAAAPPTHEVITKRIGEAHIIEGREFVADAEGAEFPTIPPQADDWRITAITPIQDDVTLYALWPHMHVRGKDMTFIATYPDGREEVLLHVPKYDFQWQLQYQLVEPVHLPAGSTIKAIGHYDNSSGNRNNPRPSAPVSWSEQSWDEMFNGWMEISVDKDVIGKATVYTLATPAHGRVSLGVSGGPVGMVYVRNTDGGVGDFRTDRTVAVVHRAVDVRARSDDSDRAQRSGHRPRHRDALRRPARCQRRGNDRRPDGIGDDRAARTERPRDVQRQGRRTRLAAPDGQHDEPRHAPDAERRRPHDSRVHHIVRPELHVANGDIAGDGNLRGDHRSGRHERRHRFASLCGVSNPRRPWCRLSVESAPSKVI